ncbi:hypothetical protein MICRO8M_60097 [Microbacterium sp. 8M]|nr:hypothetical protein MICRO8M_60097 [Microbacterium sp. 8M]
MNRSLSEPKARRRAPTCPDSPTVSPDSSAIRDGIRLTGRVGACYCRLRRAGMRTGGGPDERIDVGAPDRSHGRAIGRPGAPRKRTPERHDHEHHP